MVAFSGCLRLGRVRSRFWLLGLVAGGGDWDVLVGLEFLGFLVFLGVEEELLVVRLLLESL